VPERLPLRTEARNTASNFPNIAKHTRIAASPSFPFGRRGFFFKMATKSKNATKTEKKARPRGLSKLAVNHAKTTKTTVPAKTAGETAKINPNERGSWKQKIEPNIDKLAQMYANGATKTQLALWLNVSTDVFQAAERNHPEFKETLIRARMNAADDVAGAMYKIALGYKAQKKSGRLVPYIDKDGREKMKKIQFIEEVEVPPNVSAQMYFLKRTAGWSENPLVDEALASNVSVQNEILDKMRERLGMKEMGTPRSRAQTDEERNRDIITDDQLDAEGA